jgi:hypothetical protein
MSYIHIYPHTYLYIHIYLYIYITYMYIYIFTRYLVKVSQYLKRRRVLSAVNIQRTVRGYLNKKTIQWLRSLLPFRFAACSIFICHYLYLYFVMPFLAGFLRFFYLYLSLFVSLFLFTEAFSGWVYVFS